MKFSTETRLSIDNFADSIPIIHGKNFYIDEFGYVSTVNKAPQNVFDKNGETVSVKSISQITEFIHIINNKLSFKTSSGFLVTDLSCNKEKYTGGFQGIVGFTPGTDGYEFQNNNVTDKSTVIFTGRINSSKQLELKIGSDWIVPLGEFRCLISDTFYNIGYDSILPNSFGDTFEVTLISFKSATISPDTNYIRDAFVSGNTLYLSTRLKMIGSTPYDWSSIDTATSSVIWSEDSRLSNCNLVGNPMSSYFYAVNYNTSNVYWVSGEDFSILQEYEHKLPILGVGSIDKFGLAIIDKEACSILTAYVSLNTWLLKIKTYFPFNQLSAYEEITSNYLRETIHYVKDLDALVIKSTQRANIMLYILGNQVLSGCHTDTTAIAGDYSCFQIDSGILYKYTKVEDSGEYEDLNFDTGNITYDSYIYIGSDLEPDMGGSTLADTEITFEGKIVITDGEDMSPESSGDIPDSDNLPVRTNQTNPDNKWYLYSKTVRYPVSYTDWVQIGLMPTTKIFNIKLQSEVVQINNNNSKKKRKK